MTILVHDRQFAEDKILHRHLTSSLKNVSWSCNVTNFLVFPPLQITFQTRYKKKITCVTQIVWLKKFSQLLPNAFISRPIIMSVNERLSFPSFCLHIRHLFRFFHFSWPIFCRQTSLVAWWSEFLTTNYEVPGLIPGSTMCVFPWKGKTRHGDHGLGS